MRFESTQPDTRRHIMTAVVLVANLALAIAPAVIGLMALFGVVR